MKIAAQTTETVGDAFLDTSKLETRSLDSRALETICDADLLDAWVRDQHRPSLAVLIQRYSVMVLSVCRRRCRTESDAEDAFQSTFLYLARNSRKIRHPERLPGWLHRVAQRASIATLKSALRESEPMVDPPAKPEDPLDRLTQRHEAIVLDEELSDLPEHYRSAIVMHLYEGRSIQGLAEHFGTTVGSIRGRLQRGKQLLAQKLRSRGVIPVMAFAAANAWTASAAQAAESSHALIDATSSGDLPDPPIDTPLLESLLSQGVRLMPSLYTIAGLVGGSALITLLMMTDGSQGQTSGKFEVSFPPSVVAQFSGGGAGGDGGGVSVSSATGGDSDDVIVATVVPDQGKLVWTEKAVMPEPTSSVAKVAEASFDQEFDFQIGTSLSDLPKALSQIIGVPVILDDRGVKFAELDPESTNVDMNEQSVPLRTALRRMLRPMGLKAVIEDEGMVITADTAVLVHQGIGTTRWINIDEEAEQRIAKALDSEAAVDFVDLPLADAIAMIAADHELPIIIDQVGLDNMGITSDESVSLSIQGIKLRSLISMMLKPLELTYTVQDESLVVTSNDDSAMLNRIYWLEGTGYAEGDYEPIMESIQTTLSPDNWAEMGGASTMVPLGVSRPALLIHTSYTIHESLDRFFKTLRETHFGNDPVLESVQVPQGGQRGGLGGVAGPGGFSGGGGGGGGGGFF